MKKQSIQFSAFIIWLFVTLFYCYQYVLRLLPNILMPELMQHFSIGANEFGDFAGIYYIGYILMQIPMGILISRFGAKYVLPISIFIASLGALPMGISENWNMVIFGRFMIGVGTSAAIIGAFQIFREIFPNHFARMIGTFVCVGLLTAIYISKPLTIVAQNLGFKEMVYVMVAAGIILAAFTYATLPKTSSSKTENIVVDIKEIFSNYRILLMSFFAGLMVAPLEGFADAWGTAFIRTVYEIDRQTSDSIVSSILTGMCIGSLLLPFIADRTRKFYGVTIAAGIIMAISFAFMLTGLPNKIGLYLLCLIIGICSAYQVVIIAHISTFVRLPLSGMASSISNMIIMAFGFFFHKIIAFVIESSPGKLVVDNVPIYSYEAFINGVTLIPLAIFIAVIGFVTSIMLKKA